MSPPPSERHVELGDTRLVGACAVIASCLGRAVAPALPGSSAGIGSLIARLDHFSNFLTQFVVVLGIATAGRLLLSMLRYRLVVFRPVAILGCAVVFPLVVSASSHRLAPAWLLALGVGSAIVATAAAGPALRSPASRVAGLVLCLASVGSLVAASARILGLNASQQAQASLFRIARGVASVGMGLEMLLLVVVGLWLSRRGKRSQAVVAGLLAVSIGVVWAGLHGSDAAGWRVFLGRALASVATHPDPYFSLGVRYLVDVLAILLAGFALCQRGGRGVGEALGFALLARVSGDVPVCGLMLVLAALAAVRASQEPLGIVSAASGRATA